MNNNNSDPLSSSSSYSSLRSDIKKMMTLLTFREKKIIELRFGVKDRKPRTLEEISAVFALAPSTIRRIERNALQRIRKKLIELKVEDEVDIGAGESKIADLNIDFGIIQVSNRISELIIKYISQNPQKIKQLDRRILEEMVFEFFGKFGYDVELTAPTRDGGRDVIAIKHKEVMVKYLIECKRPDPHNKVGIVPVRSLYGVKVDEKATKAILATTTSFTKPAMIFFERHKWELEPRDYDGIVSWVKEYMKIIKKDS